MFLHATYVLQLRIPLRFILKTILLQPCVCGQLRLRSTWQFVRVRIAGLHWFCRHELGCKMSRRLDENIQCFHAKNIEPLPQQWSWQHFHHLQRHPVSTCGSGGWAGSCSDNIDVIKHQRELMEQPCLWENDVYVDLMWRVFLVSVATFKISIKIYTYIETSLDRWSPISIKPEVPADREAEVEQMWRLVGFIKRWHLDIQSRIAE